MARRATERLNQPTINKLTHKERFQPGYHADGNGLYLHVGDTGTASWIFRFMLTGRAREMGLGALHTIGLAEARDRAQTARKLKLDGTDPLAAREAEKQRKAEEAAKAVSFKKAAEGYIKAHSAGWRNKQHAWQWGQTLEAHVYPVIGDLAVGSIDTGHVTKILNSGDKPLWTSIPETAARLRGRIEVILDYAKTHGWRTGENPARWKGHLQNVLPPRAKVAKVEHHPALPWQEIGAFMAKLDTEAGTAALALRFTILTAARTNEAINATWAEIDMRTAVWTVPDHRMKANKEHRVPLSDAALAVLREIAKLRQSDAPDALLFPGGKGATSSKPISNMAMLALLRRMERADLTVHGFRSTFRDWAAETGQPDDIAEAALAHTLGNKTQAAYQRGDLLERRRRLMTAWAAFCGRPMTTDGDVVVLATKRA